MRSILWMSASQTRALRALVQADATVVSSAQEFLAAPRDAKTVAFIASAVLPELEGKPVPGNVVVVCDEQLGSTIPWLSAYPWLAHVISDSMLDHPLAEEHLRNVTSTLTDDRTPRLLDWLAPSVAGRRIRLTHASKRVERLERMGEFMESKGIGTRTTALLRDAAEELLTNAFYDAPVAAGAASQPISRTQDVALPDDSACDMVYGCRDDLAVVRVRDPFGSLTRQRLVDVLTRCSRTDMQVQVDETMGGAGLGLWRIFAVASFVAISVVAGRHTEFLVGIGKKASGPRPFAFHLLFREGAKRRFWRILDDNTSNPTANRSVTIVTK